MATDEAYRLRAWRASEEQEYELAASFDPGDGQYHEDDLEVIAGLELLSSVYHEAGPARRLAAFPNPATDCL